MNIRLLFTLLALLAFTAGCEVPEVDFPEATAPVADVADVESEPPTATADPHKATGLDPKKGKLSRKEGGYLGSVLGGGMYAQHQVVFLNIEHAINIDYGLNGDFPKSHEEFMERVIKFNQITLPELDEGDEYLYDPEDHTLKIFRPEE